MKNLLSLLLIIYITSATAQPVLNWETNYGGTKSESIRNILQLSDGNLLVVANSASKDEQVTGHSLGPEQGDVWIYKIDLAGNLIWAADCLGGTGLEIAYTAVENPDSTIMVIVETGSDDYEVTYTHGAYDAWIIQLSADGELLWQKCYGGDEDEGARAAVRSLEDNGVVITGYAGSSLNGDITNFNPGEYDDLWFWKLEDGDSAIVWQQYYGGSSFEWTYSISTSPDGYYYSAASSGSTDGDVTDHIGATDISDYWVLKLDNLGALVWSKSVGGTGNDYITTSIATSDGGVLVTGFSYSDDMDAVGHHGGLDKGDALTIKLSADGEVEWSVSLGGSGDETPSGLFEVEDGYLLTGNTWSEDGDVGFNHGETDLWIVKLDHEGNIVWEETYGGSKSESGRSIFRLGTEYYIGGYATSLDGDVEAHYGGVDNNKLDCWIIDLSICDLVTTAGYSFTTDDLTATFTDTSAYPLTYLWDFGDGAISEEASPEHTYATNGTYTVCLYVTGLCGSDTFCSEVIVFSCGIITTAGFGYVDDELTVDFTDASVNATTLLWDFGDGATSTETNPEHVYPGSGVYMVCQYATGLCETDTFCIEITVTSCDIVTTSGFSYLADGLTVNFTDESANADIINWDFGDDATSSESDPEHIFLVPGDYNVCQFTAGLCNDDTDCEVVSVSDDVSITDNGSIAYLIYMGEGLYTFYPDQGQVIESITLFGYDGRSIRHYPVIPGVPLIIDIGLEPKGCYFLVVRSASGMNTYRLIN